MSTPDARILIAGGGVAALETCLGLHWDGSIDAEITVVSRTRDFVYRPLAVLEPFGHSTPPSYPVREIVAGCAKELVFGDLSAIDLATGEARMYAGRTFDFDAAVIATGTEPASALEEAIVIGAHGTMKRLEFLVSQIDAGMVDRIVFAVPDAPSWTVPIYELAMFTAARARQRLRRVDVQLVTPQEEPLIEFGEAASESVTTLLVENGVDLVRGVTALRYDGTTLEMSDGCSIEVPCVVALPELTGAPILGIPHDERGFIPVDGYGRVEGTANIFAAGDITDFPVKQGGMASQEADAVVGAITEMFGGRAALHPLEPELRGLLFSPDGREYLHAAGGPEEEAEAEGTRRSLYEDGAQKIFSRHLGRRLQQLSASRIALR